MWRYTLITKHPWVGFSCLNWCNTLSFSSHFCGKKPIKAAHCQECHWPLLSSCNHEVLPIKKIPPENKLWLHADHVALRSVCPSLLRAQRWQIILIINRCTSHHFARTRIQIIAETLQKCTGRSPAVEWCCNHHLRTLSHLPHFPHLSSSLSPSLPQATFSSTIHYIVTIIR